MYCCAKTSIVQNVTKMSPIYSKSKTYLLVLQQKSRGLSAEFINLPNYKKFQGMPPGKVLDYLFYILHSSQKRHEVLSTIK